MKGSYDHTMKFPQKLWEIVNDNSSSAVKWGPGGKSILVEYQTLQKEYLFSNNSIFKTRNVGSFVRQLNLYGFRKLTSFYRDPSGNIQRPHVHEYLHDYFQANHKELLQHVRRKSSAKAKEPPKEKCYVHEFNENKFANKIFRKSSLQECQTALTKALEQAVCDYRREKYLKYLKEMENFSLQYAVTPEGTVTAVLGARKPKDSEQKVVQPEILINAEDIVYRIPQDYSHILIPIKENVDFQLCFQNAF